MKHRNSHFAVGYWKLICRGRPAPDHADIDPKALKRVLPFVFLLEARDSGFLYRLAGTTLCERYGGELRGRDFLRYWDGDSRARLPKLLRESLAESTPICLSSVVTTDDRRIVEMETVLMPLTTNGGVPDRFLGVAQVLSDVRPLLGHCITSERLVGAALVREGECAEPAEAPPPQTVIQFHRRRASRTPRGAHLQLVVSRAEPARGLDRLRFDGNSALAALLARCEADDFAGTPNGARESNPGG
jgi:hypothetical protein